MNILTCAKTCEATPLFTGDTFRSYVLVVMSHARYPCATPVISAKCSIIRPSRPDTGDRFRSCDLPLIRR